MKNIPFIYLLPFLLFPFFSLSAQRASNINYQSAANKIIITYDLTGATKNVRLTIRPGLVIGSQTADFDVIKSTSGDVGQIASINGPKTIIWDYTKDLPNLPNAFSIEIEVIPELSEPISHGLSFSGNSLAPLGIKYHLLGNNGFYLSGKILNTNFQKVKGTSGELEKGKSIAPQLPYQFVEAQRQSYCINAGYSRMIKPFLFGYAGIGLGIDRTLWNVVDLDADCNPTTNTYWVEAGNYEKAGKTNLLLEIGATVKAKRFLFDIGTGMSQFKDLYFNFGVGFVLKSRI